MNVFSKNKDIRILDYINKKSLWKRVIQFLIGSFIVSIAYNIFMVPNNIVPGGVAGLAIIFHKLIGVDNSTFIFIVNSGLLILSFLLLGKKQTQATLVGSIITPFFIRATADINVWIGMDTSHVLLSTIFGGILYGTGVGLMFRAGFTAGGTDIINQIISKYAKVSIGTSMLMSDGLIVLSSGVFFGLNGLLYSLFILYIISIISDHIILGISDSKVFFIITRKEEEIRSYILENMGHGVTIFKASGGYAEINEHVLMTVLPTKSYYSLKEGIKKIDKKAFYIIADTYQVFGGV